MPRYFISSAADADMDSVLTRTYEHFGESARRRYAALLVRAIMDVAENPDRAGSHARPEIAPNARTYHLLHSRNRVTADVGRVKRPRHFLLYRILAKDEIVIGRVLHDSMDLPRHLPEDYRSGFSDEEERGSL